MAAKDYPYHLDIEVYYRDIDVMGHVNNTVYFSYMEIVRVKFLSELMQRDIMTDPTTIAASSTCDYKSEALCGEILTIGIGIAEIGNKSMTMIYRIDAQDGRLVATGKTVQVWYNHAKKQSSPVPEHFRKRVAEFQGDWRPE
jgi:acyl-CoA thioester hydrolase